MKTVTIAMLFWYITACTGIENILAKAQSGDFSIHECFAKFVKERFDKTDVIICQAVQLKPGPLQGIMTYLTQNLMQSGYTITFWTCVQEGCQQKRRTTYSQFVIYAADDEELDYILSQCICTQYSATTDFIVLSPSENKVMEMLKVIRKNNIFRHSSTVVTATDNRNDILKYFKGFQRCSRYTDIASFTYNCSIKNPQNMDIIGNKSQTWYFELIGNCNYSCGVRQATPFAFLGNAKQAEMLGLDKSKPHYLGFEIAILATLFNRPGISVDVFSNISSIHSLGLYDKKTNNKTGLIKELYEGRVDIVLGAIGTGEGGVEFESNYPTTQYIVIAVVKKQNNINIFVIFDTFHYQVWLVILFLQVFFVSVISVCFRRYSNLSIGTAVMFLLAALLGKEIPIRKANLKLIFLSWIMFSLFIRASFEALSVEHLANKDDTDQTDSLQYICFHDYKIFVPDFLQDYFKHGFNTSGCNIPSDRFAVVDDPLESVAKDTTGRAAAFTYELTYMSEKMRFINEDGENLFHLVKERVAAIPIVFLVRNGDSLKSFLEIRFMEAFQTGLVQMFVQSVTFFNSLETEDILRNKEINISLKFKHIQVLLCLYLFGIALASIAFAGEIIYFKFSKNRANGANPN